MDSDWKVRQARLNEDIERFSMSDLTGDQGIKESGPALLQAGSVAPTAASAASAASATPAAPRRAVDAPERPAASGLLAELKRQAEAKLATASQSVAIEAVRLKQMDGGLRAAYRYLNDLAQQLNVLKPVYPAAYSLGTVLRLENPVWVQGRADFRRQAGATDNPFFERVTLHYVLRRELPIVIEKLDNAIDLTRRTLIDFGLDFTLDEKRNPKGFIESGRFTVQPEIKAGLVFTADYAKGEVRLRTLNVRQFGNADYLVPAEAISEQTLEEIALLILGESNQFVQRFRRIA